MHCVKLAILGLFLVAMVSSKTVTISNTQPRRDTAGRILDSHDGSTLLIDGVYYQYGASYGLCREFDGQDGCAHVAIDNCGFQLNHTVSLFTSPDLVTWTSRGAVWDMTTQHPQRAIMYCPRVVYNARTKLYVLWYNYLPTWAPSPFSVSLYAVATSASPSGPFTLANLNVTTLAFKDTGDFNLFVDDDRQAYIIYTAHIAGPEPSHRMSIERLTPDYLSTEGAKASTGFFGDSFVEAPSMFKRNGVYYALFGQCCCFCGAGSAVRFYTASSPLGPWKPGQLITSAIPAQQLTVVAARTSNGTAFIWQGDRWQSAPDRIKAHDFVYQGVLQFDSAGNVQALPWRDSFTLDLP